ncbi:MAG: HAMP domain-containing histidine kinase [Lachnospiraceae bacterium]|nr:HAMP domain-containing histidine kinase [Lachnospiraceae bacterium]
MKLTAKYFLCTVVVLSLSLTLMGYFFIYSSFKNSIDREVEQSMTQYQLTKFALQANMLAYGFEWDDTTDFFDQLSFDTSRGTLSFVAIYDAEYNRLFSNYDEDYIVSFPENVDSNHLVYQVDQAGTRYLMTVIGYFDQDGKNIYMFSSIDITPVMESREEMIQTYFYIYATVLVIGIAVIFIFSFLITRPINQLIKTTSGIAGGDYSERVEIRARDEIGILGESFNRMAVTIEQNIDDLKDSLEQKEQFVANFSHELKTPLTSVIGYADMIYQRKLSPEETRQAASFILNEGLRLEALSQKMMDMIVLNRQDFTLESLEATEILDNVLDTVRPMCEKHEVKLHYRADHAYIRVEFDLFKTMIMNFVDNAVKANTKEIYLLGVLEGAYYNIYVYDRGIGIPASELGKITEAFYMVDKSRSRRQHGAGLGLALAKKIADIHRAELKIMSREGEGTCVKVRMHTDEEDA